MHASYKSSAPSTQMKQNTHITIIFIDTGGASFKQTPETSLHYQQCEHCLRITEVFKNQSLIHHYPWHIIKAWHVTEQNVSLSKEE